MSDLRPRTNRPGTPKSIARHGRLKSTNPFAALAKVVVAAFGVLLVSGVSVAAIAAWDIGNSLKPSVHLVDAKGNPVPQIGAMDGSFNVLLAGSDSGDGNKAYGERGENLNDVTMLLHVSADHKQATVVSFPRDMFVPIPSCPDPKGGSFSAMSYQKINTTLTYGGLNCTVLTLQQLTGMTIPFAAMIQFDGVIEMSNAVGGVPVCLAGRLDDDRVNPALHLAPGNYTLKGGQALSFLRTRHAIGDGSDLGRISNQQSFLSSLVRTIKTANTLGDPTKVYGLAKAAASNMTLSESLNNIGTMASMAAALKNVDLANVTFVQYPNHYVDGGVAPTEDAAKMLFTALKHDTPIKLTGDAGVGTEVDPAAKASKSSSSDGSSTVAKPDAAPTPSTPTASSAEGSTSSSTDASTAAPVKTKAPAVLPDSVHGQTASERTCAKSFTG